MTHASAFQVVVPATSPDVPPVAPMAPVPPQSPAVAPATPGAFKVTVDANGRISIDGVPRTAAQYKALEQRKEELSSQLLSAAGRRERLARELRNSPEGPLADGLMARVAVLDRRIADLESDIDANGQMLAAAPINLQSTASSSDGMPFDIDSETAGDIAQLSVFFVFFPIAIAVSRLIWKRARPAPAPVELTNAAQRLERMEQSVDAIAIEMERVSEGQRFLTRILSEARGGAAPALDVGQAPARPIPVPVPGAPGVQAERVRQET